MNSGIAQTLCAERAVAEIGMTSAHFPLESGVTLCAGETAWHLLALGVLTSLVVLVGFAIYCQADAAQGDFYWKFYLSFRLLSFGRSRSEERCYCSGKRLA